MHVLFIYPVSPSPCRKINYILEKQEKYIDFYNNYFMH